jgi:hypothetical protein
MSSPTHSNNEDTPTKEPFSSAGESKTGGSNILFGIVAAPFAAVGGLVDQVSRKFTRAEQQATKTIDTEEPTKTSEN